MVSTTELLFQLTLLFVLVVPAQMATLADSKSTHEVNALKGLALEHVGAIAARVRHDLGEAGTGIKSVREVRLQIPLLACAIV